MRNWFPLGVRHACKVPEVGTTLAIEHAVWRVVAVNPVPKDLWTEGDERTAKAYAKWSPEVLVIRPIQVTGDDPRARDRDRHLRTNSPYHTFHVFPDEHYPVCARCHEPLPCREQESAEEAAQAAAVMGRHDLPGVCPACEEPITARQKTHTFPDNLVVPLGPPVTFHIRNGCIAAAAKYDRRWVAADPASRTPSLFCDGTMTTHGTLDRECTSLSCPGVRAVHLSYTICQCPRRKVGAIYEWDCTLINEVTS